MTSALLATWNEVWKGLIIRWSYKFSILMELLMIVFIFIGITFFMGGGTFDASVMGPSLVGYIVWFYALIAIANMSWGLREETQTGTLEQLYMSPYPIGLLLVGRTFATLVMTTAEVLIAGTLLVLILQVPLPFDWAAIPIGLLTLAGLYGFGFVIGGATLLFKQVESMANLFQNILLFLNGALLPVDRLPPWLESIALTLPSTVGIIVLRRVLFDGATWLDVWQDGSLPMLLLNSAAYCIGGLAVYLWCERVARAKGLLGQY